MMIGRSGTQRKLTGVAVRAALTALLAIRLVILPAVASANPVPQVDPNLLPVCTVYGLYYVDLRTGEKIPADDQDQQQIPKTDDCTFCHFVCNASFLEPKDTTSDLAPLVRVDRLRLLDGSVVRLQLENTRFHSRAPPAI